jgi:hypothetical protein
MKKIIGFICLLVCANAYAQNYSLAYFKGTVEVSNGGSFELLKTIGTSVGKNQSVKVGEKSEAIFTGSKGETVLFKTAGTYAVTDFAKYVTSADKSSLSSYYLNYVAHQVTHKAADAEKNYKEQLKNLGGVSRAGNYHCLQGPVNATYVVDSNIRFVWSDYHRDNYTLTIYSDIDRKTVKVKQTVKDTTATLNRFVQKFDAGKTYYWTITAENTRPCEIFSFSVMTKEEQDKVTMELNKLRLQIDFTGGMKEAVIGKFYESKGFYENARNSYVKAVKLEPESESFKEILNDFDNGILSKQ